PRSTLFPYTTLFRSLVDRCDPAKAETGTDRPMGYGRNRGTDPSGAHRRRRRRAPLRGGKDGGLRTGAAWGTEGRGRSSGCQVSLADSQCWAPYLDGATETWNSQYVWGCAT